MNRIKLLLLLLLPLALAAAPAQSDQTRVDPQATVAEQRQEIEALRLKVYALALHHRLLSLKLELLGGSGPDVLESQHQEAVRAFERLAELDIDIAALSILNEEMVALAERLREGSLAAAMQSINSMLEPLVHHGANKPIVCHCEHFALLSTSFAKQSNLFALAARLPRRSVSLLSSP